MAQTFWYPKRANLVLVYDTEDLFSMELPGQAQNVTKLVVSAMLAVWWLEANAGMTEQEILSRVRISKRLDLFKTTFKVLRIPKETERMWGRQRLMPWFRAVMTAWVYERAKRHMSRNTEAYRSFQLDIGPGVHKRAFLTHKNGVTTAFKRVAGLSCTTE